MNRVLLLVLGCLLLCPVPARAQATPEEPPVTLTLKDNSRVEGRLLEFGQRLYRIRVGDQVVTISESQVREIRFADAADSPEGASASKPVRTWCVTTEHPHAVALAPLDEQGCIALPFLTQPLSLAGLAPEAASQAIVAALARIEPPARRPQGVRVIAVDRPTWTRTAPGEQLAVGASVRFEVLGHPEWSTEQTLPEKGTAEFALVDPAGATAPIRFPVGEAWAAVLTEAEAALQSFGKPATVWLRALGRPARGAVSQVAVLANILKHVTDAKIPFETFDSMFLTSGVGRMQGRTDAMAEISRLESTLSTANRLKAQISESRTEDRKGTPVYRYGMEWTLDPTGLRAWLDELRGRRSPHPVGDFKMGRILTEVEEVAGKAQVSVLHVNGGALAQGGQVRFQWSARSPLALLEALQGLEAKYRNSFATALELRQERHPEAPLWQLTGTVLLGYPEDPWTAGE